MQHNMFVIYNKDNSNKPATLVISENQVKHSRLFKDLMNHQINYYYTNYDLEKIKKIFVYYQRPDLVWFETKCVKILIEYLEITYNLKFNELWKRISNHLANRLNGKTVIEMSKITGLPMDHFYAVESDIEKINSVKKI